VSATSTSSTPDPGHHTGSPRPTGAPRLDDRLLSVVVQGPATAALATTVASVRRWLPRAELIVSSWEGADVDGIDADVVVLSADPGSVPYLDIRGRPTKKLFNTNRMIRSTKAGVARATRPYLLKMRNDTPLRSDLVLEWLARPDGPRTDDLRIFRRRIIMPNIAVRPAETMRGLLFHPSDIVHAGLADDVRALWEAADEIDETENTEWFLHHPQPVPAGITGGYARYYNEQVVWLACLRRHGLDPGYDCVGHVTPELIERSTLGMVNNFRCVEPWQLGITLSFDQMVRLSAIWNYAWFDGWQRAVEQLAAA